MEHCDGAMLFLLESGDYYCMGCGEIVESDDVDDNPN